MKVLISQLVLLGVLPVSAWTATLEWPVWQPGTELRHLPAYRGDRVSVQLRAPAVQAILARSAAFPARSVGLTALDQALAELGARLEPEFRGVRPPARSSTGTDLSTFFLVDLSPGTDLAGALDRLRALS